MIMKTAILFISLFLTVATATMLLSLKRQVGSSLQTAVPSQTSFNPEDELRPELLVFMDMVAKDKVTSLPKTAKVDKCWNDYCQVAGWEFKINPPASKNKINPLMQAIDVTVAWPDQSTKTVLKKDVNLGAIEPDSPALLTYRFVEYGTYRGQLPQGKYDYSLTFLDGHQKTVSIDYQGEIFSIPHDISLIRQNNSLIIRFQQEKPTASLERYDLLLYPENKRFPGFIQSFDVLSQVAGPALEQGREVEIRLDNLSLNAGVKYVVELSAKAGAAHTGTGQYLTLEW